MPLARDEGREGTNADGSKSAMYCSHCYASGRFIAPDITVKQMQMRVKGNLKEGGFSGFVAGLFTRRILKLERWSKR
jgi:hypothetical protein